MADLDDAARQWLTGRTRAVLITVRSDGSPQSSNVLAAFDGTSYRVSVTADRAKTRNLARDPRAIVHVVGDDFWSYASVSCQATLGEVTTTPGDDAGRALLDDLPGDHGEDPRRPRRVLRGHGRRASTRADPGPDRRGRVRLVGRS